MALKKWISTYCWHLLWVFLAHRTQWDRGESSGCSWVRVPLPTALLSICWHPLTARLPCTSLSSVASLRFLKLQTQERWRFEPSHDHRRNSTAISWLLMGEAEQGLTAGHTTFVSLHCHSAEQSHPAQGLCGTELWTLPAFKPSQHHQFLGTLNATPLQVHHRAPWGQLHPWMVLLVIHPVEKWVC